VLLLTIAALFAILLYLSWSTFAELDRQRQGPPDSAQWALYQTSLEFHRLNNAFAVYRIEDSAENLMELTKRFDIFYSRIRALGTGQALAHYRDEAFFVKGLEQFTTFVEHLAALFDGKQLETLRTDAALAKEFRDVEAQAAVFTTTAVQVQSARNEQTRSALKRLLFMQLVTFGLFILAFGYFALIVLQQRNSALKRETDLRESRDLLRTIIKSSLDSVLIADAKGNIVDLNDATAAMFGFANSEMTGHEMSGLIMPERLRPAHKAGMERYAATGKAKVMGRRIEIDALRRDGTEFPIELSITSTGQGEKAQYVAFMRDITDRRMAEQSLKKAKEDAEAANRAKAQFLAAISHEMRTPLTGILGALDLIAATDLSEQQHKYVRTANRSGHALLSVISDVLDISRLEDGRVDLDIDTVDLDEIVVDVVEIVGQLARERDNAIELRLDDGMPAKLLGDAARIRQVLLNFATNAVKFTHGGLVTISAAEIGRTGDHVEVEIAVRDTGPGIPESDQDKLFKNFSRLNSGSSHMPGGTGLGLAISKRLVDLMGGSIGVETKVGEGSRFWFRLTLEVDAGDVPGEHETTSVQPAPPQPAPRRVLVVDDNETVRSIVLGQLAAGGHHAQTAENAVKAVAMLKSMPFDVVILDISMPVMDGFEALRIIRGMPGAAGQTPVVALTAHALIEVRERCAAAGFDHFLTKPVRVDELARVIAAVTKPGTTMAVPRPAQAGGPEEPLFELRHLREQFSSVGNDDLRRIVERFGAELDKELALLSDEGSEISPLHLRRIVHVLAGSSSMIGAERLAALSSRLDALASCQEDAELAASVDDLVGTIRETRTAVEEVRRHLLAEGAPAASA
jgi:PAS domain S-box-containing protein